MVSALQWAIALGRLNVLTALMEMVRFQACLREGHLDRLKCIYGYLHQYKHGTIHFRTEIPNMSQYPKVEYDWMYSVYGDIQEAVPHNAPTPLGKEVITVTSEDANLCHDMTAARAVMVFYTLSTACPSTGFPGIRTP